MLRSVKYGLYGAVLAGLVAAPVVWMNVDKSVHLTVDGTPVSVTTSASNVGTMLKDQGYAAGTHDIVAPAASSAINDGMNVVLRRGRLLHLSVDGKPMSVWTTAPTVQVALAQLGFSQSDFVSVSRSKRLPLDPTAIAIRTPRLVTVVHDGRRDTVSTTQPTVDRLLSDLKITLGGHDKLSVPPTAQTLEGQTITLQRVGIKTLTRTVELRYGTARKDDMGMNRGDTKVITPGRNGKAQIVYVVTLVDGKQAASRKVRTVTLTEARTQVIAVGTKQVVVRASRAANPNPGSARAFAKSYMQSRYGWGADQYDCLSQLWGHESGWRVNAANPSGAYGIPQALPGSKMSSAGSDWQTNGETQVKWGLGYVKGRYNTPCGAWGFWQSNNYY